MVTMQFVIGACVLFFIFAFIVGCCLILFYEHVSSKRQDLIDELKTDLELEHKRLVALEDTLDIVKHQSFSKICVVSSKKRGAK